METCEVVMYEKIQNSHKKYRGTWLCILLICSLLFCAITVAMVSRILAQHQRFKQYISDFSRSTSYAYSQGHMVATMEDRQRRIVGERVYSVYNLIINCRGIKEQSCPKTQPEIILEFGDNSKMELWTSELENAGNSRKYGLLICYYDQEGKSYCYDTDRLDIDRVKLLLKDRLDYAKTAPTE